MGLVEERETRSGVDTLLARLMDNIPVLARPADTQRLRRATRQALSMAEATLTPAQGQGTTGDTGESRGSSEPWWRRWFGG